MTQKTNISIQDTTQFLQDTFASEITELTLLSGGEWSQAYSFVHENKKYVLRWCNASQTFERDAVASSFSCKAMPVPKITDTGTKFDKFFAISEFAQGDFIETLNSTALENTLHALFDLLDAVRNVDLSKTSGCGGWDKNGNGNHKSWKEFLLDVKSNLGGNLPGGWYTNLANSTVGTKIFDELYTQLESQVNICHEVRELIHSDLLHCNVLVSDAKISAVIDWQCSLYGDSLYDIAWFVFYAPWYPQFTAVKLCPKLLGHFESVAAHTANVKARLLCYQLHIGLGSMAYNSFKKDWKAAEKIGEYTLTLFTAASPDYLPMN